MLVVPSAWGAITSRLGRENPLIRIVGACISECESCRLQGTKPCVQIEREPSGTRETLCLNHVVSLIADLTVTLLCIESCVNDGTL